MKPIFFKYVYLLVHYKSWLYENNTNLPKQNNEQKWSTMSTA